MVVIPMREKDRWLLRKAEMGEGGRKCFNVCSDTAAEVEIRFDRAARLAQAGRVSLTDIVGDGPLDPCSSNTREGVIYFLLGSVGNIRGANRVIQTGRG